MNLRTRAILLALSVSVLTAFAQDVKVEKYTLPNGMRVILHEDHSLPVASVNIWFYVGAKDEPDRRSGFAHLFEHLMFMGTERVPRGQFDTIMEGGGGSNNASTSSDRTNYFESGPANLLPTLLYLEADRLEDLGRTMTKEKVDIQRDVVKNERRQTTENVPYGKAEEAIGRLMYPKGHPYSTSVIGSMADLDNASVKDVQDFFATYYVPNNASLVVAGDFKPADIKPTIEKLFGTLPRQNDVPRKFPVSIPPIGIKRVTFVDSVPAAKSKMVWHSPAWYQAGDAEMDLVGQLLSNGITSKLYQRLVTEKKLASEVSASQDSQLLGSLFTVEATLAKGSSQGALEAEMDKVLEEFLRQAPKPQELKRITAQLEFGSLTELQSIMRKADKLNEYEFIYGEPNSFKRDLDRFRTATPSGILKVAQKTLDMGNRLILRVVLEMAKVEPNPRTERPTIGTPPAFAPEMPKEFALSNGMKVFYFSRPELPVMSLIASFPAGAATDPNGKFGRAALTAVMLSQGAGTRSASDFSDAMDRLGANFSASASVMTTQASLDVISANFVPALELYADALIRPRFDTKEWERVQRLTIEEFAQERNRADSVARKVSMREFFGVAHPYGRPTSGDESSVAALKLEDFRAASQTILRPETSAIFVAGSLDQKTVQAQLEKALGGWKSNAVPPTAADFSEPAHDKLRVVIVDRPKAVQTVVSFIMPSPAYISPNRTDLEGISNVLGGGFTSRLNQNLREDKGYTYGAGSSFTFTPHVGYFSARAAVRADVTGASLREFLKEFAKIRTGDISEPDVVKASATMRTAAIEGIESLRGLISTAASLYAKGRPFSAFSEDLTQVSQLKATRLNSMVNTAIPLERGLLVLVGDKGLILEQLKGLDLPTPEIVQP